MRAQHEGQAHPVDITLLCCTYNRRADLREMLESALGQVVLGLSYEILVVDNNSTDGTRAEVKALIEAGHSRLRYLFEPRQGKSNALNTGLSAMEGAYHAIIDDDQILPPEFLRNVWAAVQEYPGASCIGGKILPIWERPPEPWLTREHWPPLAILDYGERPLRFDSQDSRCLLTAVFKTADINSLGGYRNELGVKPGVIGSTEDADLLLRLYSAGRFAVYAPTILLLHKVPASRVQKAYHRKWHFGHGGQLAAMEDPAVESSSVHVRGVPGHIIREALGQMGHWLAALLRGHLDTAFTSEVKIRALCGFMAARWFDSPRGGA